MWCVNPMVVDTWKDPYPGYTECQEGVAQEEEDEDKVTENIPEYPSRPPSLILTRSASCNRINLALSHRKLKRSLSTSGTHRRPTVVRVDSESSSSKHLDVDSLVNKKEVKLKRSDSVLSRLARQYSFSRSRRSGSSSTNMSSVLSAVDASPVATKIKSPRRRRTKTSSKKDCKVEQTQNDTTKHLEVPKSKHGRIPSPLHINSNSHLNDNTVSSGSSCPNSPPHFKGSFSISPPSPDTKNAQAASPDDPRATSPLSADESPPSLDDKSYDSGRMSMSSFRSFGSGRPTSLSSVTSSISSRTSRGSDYFSSASSCGQPDREHQVTSYRLGLQTVLPEVDESDLVDRLVVEGSNGDCDKTESHNSPITPKSERANARARAFAAHDRHDKSLKDIDHLAPVANLAMVVNPDLSYVDRVILELLETERMYVRALQDILTGYLAKIRSTPELKIHPHDVDDLFGNIRDIYDFNRKLLGEFEDCFGDPRRVARCFVSKDEDFKVYTKYCTNYPSSVAAMTQCMQIPTLADFFKVQQDYLRHTLPLGSYLLKPVQRILKYHLLLQELVKHCDKQEEGYQTIQTALQTMTRVARHINDMKRKHEDAVHIQEIQSLLTTWQGNELTTYGELIMESEMKMQGAKNERQVFLFEKMILITKRREDGYLVCKANIMCANLVLLESLPNIPLGFQIQPFSESGLTASVQQGNGPQEPGRAQCYVLLAPSVEEKSVWTYHIKRLIIETMRAAIPLQAKKSIMRMRPMRDGDGGGGGGDSEDDRMRKKGKPRFGSSAILGNQESKTNKLARARHTTASSANVLNGNARKTSTVSPVVQNKPRRRSDSMSRKSLHKKALKHKEDVESSDEISTDSAPNTPSGLKVRGNFSFPGFRQSTRSSHVNQASKLTNAQAKSNNQQTTNSNNKKTTTEEGASENKNNTKTKQPEVVKRHHNSVVYRRHKRRTSQPITITEKRLSMKIPDDETESAEKNNAEADDKADDDDFMNFNPLTARESVSWDIQIVEAIFDRYKKEGSLPVSPNQDAVSNLGSTYMTVPSDVAPSPLMSLDHTPILSQRRKSRIIVVPSSDSSDDNAEKKNIPSNSSVIRRKKDKTGRSAFRTSGVVYDLSKEKKTESDGDVNEPKSILRKAVQGSENIRNSLVIHESDTDAETSKILKEKAVTARRKSSLKRRERKIRNKNGAERNSVESVSNERASGENRRGSFYDNVDDAIDKSDVIGKAVTSSVQCMSTQTISVVYSSSTTSASLVSTQSTSLTSISSTRTNDVTSTNCSNNNIRPVSPPIDKTHVSHIKDTKQIPSGTVRSLIERLWNSPRSETTTTNAKSGITSPTRRTPVTSPTFNTSKKLFSFEPTPVSMAETSVMCSSLCSPRNHNANNNNNNNSKQSSINFTRNIKETPVELHISEKSNCTSVVSTTSGPIMSHSLIKRESVQTTASLPLTLTSSSASSEESEGECAPTIAQRVKRISMSESENLQHSSIDQAGEAKKTPPPQIFLRRTFSRDDNNSTTRHSTNLVLETRISGEYAAENESNFHKLSADDANNDKNYNAESNTITPDDLCFTFGDSIGEAKHYLFEKLCLTAPNESKITDKMSEEFEHVCSDLEGSLRHSSMDSHVFSGSEEDNRKAAILERKFRREVSPLTQKTSLITETVSVSPITENEKFDRVQKVVEIPKIFGGTSTESGSSMRKYGQQYTGNILPNRSDSIRSTRSEYTSVRNREPESRGRSSAPRIRRPFQNNFPSKDMQAIPQKNVAKLAKQFSEICKESEKMVACAPRRSKSVEGGARMRQRLQARQRLHEKETDNVNGDETRNHKAEIKSASSYDLLSSTTRSNKNLTDSYHSAKEDKYSIQTAAVVVDEKLVCLTVTNAQKQTFAVVTSSQEHVSDGENDVFPVSPKSPENCSAEQRSAKKLSLVEMFAANPRKSKDSERDEDLSSIQDDNFFSSPEGETKVNPENDLLDKAKQNIPGVRVILVRETGSRTLEPRVLNLDSRGETNHLSSPPLEKRHSWTIRSSENDKPSTRTRLRSSSLSRNRRKAMLAPES